MTVTVTAITDPVTCTHPSEVRTTRTDHGTFDYIYDVCAACASESLTCQDDDDCGICTDGGQWSPILVPQYVPAEHLEAAGLAGASEAEVGAYLKARYEAWKAAEATITDKPLTPGEFAERMRETLDPKILIGLALDNDAATCATIIDDPEMDRDLCGEPSRFVVARSDGDMSYGINGGTDEACEEHLAETVAGMLEGDASLYAVVAVRWDAATAAGEKPGGRGR